MGVAFMRGRSVHPGWHSGTLWGSLVSSGVVGLSRELPVGHWVHPGWHSGTPWVSLGSFGVVGFTQVGPECRCDHPCSLGSLGCALVVVGFILVVRIT